MTAALRLALILCLMLTGIGLGAARGTVQIAGTVVLCTGKGVVVTRDPREPSSDSAHFCPDMALSLLAAIGGEADLPACSPNALDFRPWSLAGIVWSRDLPRAGARDPPRLFLTA